MNTWLSKDLGDGVAAAAPSRQIIDAFLPTFIAAGQPDDFAVFSRYDLGANVVTVFFTPAAATLGQVFDATPCEKPGSQRIGLLAGPQQALLTFFPDHAAQRRQ